MKLKHNSTTTIACIALLIQGADILLDMLIVVSLSGHTTVLDHMGDVAHGEFNCMYVLCTTEFSPHVYFVACCFLYICSRGPCLYG